MPGSATELAATDIHVAPGIELSARQRQLVGVVLDCFAGRCSHWRLNEVRGREAAALRRAKFFTKDASYYDAFATAEGRQQIAGQMMGLPIVCQSSVTLAHLVVAASPTHIELRMIHLLCAVRLETSG